MKKFLALVLALVTVLSLAACGAKGNPEAMDVIAEIVHDGDATKITGEAFNQYFDGNALEGVKKLLDEGKVYVNGIKVPAKEADMVEYQVNGVPSLYKTDAGWGFNVHKTTSANNLSFADARLGFYETITTVRGHKTVIYGDKETGLINKIDSESFDVVRIADIIVYNESTTVKRGEFELETQRIRPDVEVCIFNSAYFDQELKIGDFAVYYFGPKGWQSHKAVAKVGTLTKDDNKQFIVNEGKADEYVKIESNVSRYNLINCSRPSQFYSAYVRLGLTDLEVVTWCTPTGHPIGFTYGEKADAKAALTKAIANCKAAKEGVMVSVDGSDVAVGTKWVSQADMDAFDAAISAAQVICNRNSTAVQEFDAAIYELANALGEGGEKPTGFVGAQGEGTKA